MESCAGQSRLVQCLCPIRDCSRSPHCSRCFCLFDLYCQAAAADSGDSVHIVSIAGSGEPQVRDQADLDMDTRGIEAAWISDYTLRP